MSDEGRYTSLKPCDKPCEGRGSVRMDFGKPVATHLSLKFDIPMAVRFIFANTTLSAIGISGRRSATLSKTSGQVNNSVDGPL